MIGTDIVVTVLEVRGEQVRIGIKAPREVEVHRAEVWRHFTRATPHRAPDAPNCRFPPHPSVL